MSATIQILCVDDDHDIRTIALMALGLDPAIEVRAAASGPEALELLETGPVPDVVMLDVMMPGMSGPEVLAAMRDHPGLARVPVIFMTARARKADVDSYRELGAVGVIVKPFDPLRLAEDVRALIGAPRG